MYALFVCQKDSNGIERIIRRGHPYSRELSAQIALGRTKKGFLLNTGSLDTKGLNRVESFLQCGARIHAAKNMPSVEGMLS